jgi:CubicO group peptidase (beta-lactamase class C family)
MRIKRVLALWGVAATVAGVVAYQSYDIGELISSIPSGTGYAAWDMCSRGLAVGDDVERIKADYTAPKVRPLPYGWQVHVADNSVRVSFLGMHEREAVWRPGLGCTLITPGTSKAEVLAQPFVPAPALPADTRPWPWGEGVAQTELLSPARQALLAKAREAMFTEPSADPLEQRHTNALLVAQGGQLVFEHYAQAFHRERQQLGWSMTKSLTALVAGLMERDARLQLDEPVGLRAWQGTEKAAITWRHLLNMAPGIRWFEGAYGIGIDDTAPMLFSQADECAWVARLPLTDKPGTAFNYSTGFSNLAMCRLKDLAGGTHQAIYDYYQQRLFAPLGIRGGYIEPDAAGTPVGGARGFLRPVDWLRLGQLVANGGQWQGQHLMNAEYMRFMAGASPADDGYGGMVWRRSAGHIPTALRTTLPEDTVAFVGFQEQHMVIIPSRQLIVLRMGVAFDKGAAIQQVYRLAADLLATP